MVLNRRIKIAYFWIFKKKHNVRIKELFYFIRKPRVERIGLRFIKNINYSNDFKIVSFKSMRNELYLPYSYRLNELYRICAETFDTSDWHHYENGVGKVNENDIVVDAGSAEGLFSLSIVERCKKVFVVEPNRNFIRALKKTFEQFNPQKVELFNAALGDNNVLAKAIGKGISGSVVESKKGDIKITTLDNLLKDKGKITYIKADLEGWEMKMLIGAKGIISKYKPKIVITAYHRDNEQGKMINFLKQIVPEYKYRVRGISQYSGRPILVWFWV
ncbi:MAG: FkbM family methyltransferase [Candidatus Omnitrophica bacterium]|nr:FkbM family methyltransferase [Candidatus Omnitrophota bacterium]MDD5430157.1 FkbM family methyltransferase [Candidatus Omnitrophota bacterium]